MSWAMQQQTAEEPNQRFVLLILANWISDEDGDGGFPSIETMCKATGLANSTVRRKLDELQELGLICKGNQDLAQAYVKRADRRPTVWAFPKLRPLTVGGRENDRSSEQGRPPTEEKTTAQAVSADPSRKSVGEPQSARPAPEPGPREELGYEQPRSPVGTVARALEDRKTPPVGRGASFDADFKARFGVAPDEAHAVREGTKR